MRAWLACLEGHGFASLTGTVGGESQACAPGQLKSRPCPQHVESGFQHVMRLKSWAGTEGSPVSS